MKRFFCVAMGLLLAMANVDAKDTWKQVWSDEFDGNELDASKWSHMPATYSNNEDSSYVPENISVRDGFLVLRAEKGVKQDNKPWTSAAICSQGKYSQAYGKWEVRMRVPWGKGFWPAYWLMPDCEISKYGPWPACGEIDIFESGAAPDDFAGTLHYGGKNNSHGCSGIGSVKLPNGGTHDDFHVYTLEWEPTKMVWFCDGVEVGRVDKWSTYGPDGQELKQFPAPYDQPFYVIFNLAIGGDWCGRKLPDVESAEMLVDYIRVYAKDEYEMPEQKAQEKTFAVKRVPCGQEQVYDGEFKIEQLMLWNLSGAGLKEPTITNGALGLDITMNVYEQHRQFIKYNQKIKIEKDKWYRLSFKARSTVKCKHMRPVCECPKQGWHKLFLYSSLELDEEWKEFSFEFLADKSDNSAELLFYHGIMRSAGDTEVGAHRHEFKDISLIEVK